MNPQNTGGTKNKARLFEIMAVTGRTIAFRQVVFVFIIHFSISDLPKAYVAPSGGGGSSEESSRGA